MDSATTGRRPNPNATTGPRPNAATPAPQAPQRPPTPPSQQEMRRQRQGQYVLPDVAQKVVPCKRKMSASPAAKNAPPLLYDPLAPPSSTTRSGCVHGGGLCGPVRCKCKWAGIQVSNLPYNKCRAMIALSSEPYQFTAGSDQNPLAAKAKLITQLFHTSTMF